MDLLEVMNGGGRRRVCGCVDGVGRGGMSCLDGMSVK